MSRKALIQKLTGSTSGGEAERQWRDDPGANWRPPSQNGAAQAMPMPPAERKPKRTKPRIIPNARPIRGITGRRT